MSYKDLAVAFSLYGDANKYRYGAIANAKLVPKVYPEATMIVYHDSDTPQALLAELNTLNVVLKDCTDWGLQGHEKMLWRFSAGDPKSGFKYFLSRDLDSIVTDRERWCFDHFIKNFPNKVVFSIADSESHPCTPLLGGLWGTRCVWNDMKTKCLRWCRFKERNFSEMGIDQEFLRRMIYPMVQDSLFQLYAGGRAWDIVKDHAVFIEEPYPDRKGVPIGHCGSPDGGFGLL